MNIRRRLEKLEKQPGKDGLLILEGPEDVSDEDIDEFEARWMKETGNPKPGLVIYLKRFGDLDRAIRVC
ncbi:MAG: hypothetical protein L0Y39_08240 [Methylococcaceae bacterium]|nr:hypothetical protein [Methylococcaceae bacterium]